MGKSAQLREDAIGLLAQARALTDPADGTVSAENKPRFDALMDQFRAVDKAVAQAEADEGQVASLQERWAHYTGAVSGQPMRFSAFTTDPASRLTPGQQFVASEAYQKLVASKALTSPDARFRTDPITVAPRIGYGAAASDVISTDGSVGNSQGLVTPYRPGIVLPLEQRPLVVRDLFPVVDMPSGDTIEYAQQSGFDSAAAAVAQATTVNTDTLAGGLKPQSSLAWEEKSAPARWIATWMVATRQALADATQLAALIDNQGRSMIRLEEDDQVLNGNGTAPNISGIRDQQIITLDLTGADNLDGVRTARRLVQTGLSRQQPTFVVLNPVDSEEFDLLKDGNNNYRGGNPIGNFDFTQGIWRLRRVESEAMPEGKGLVGARTGATIFEREPLRVLTADQHSDFFVRNLVVILFEERIALPVYFPTAFVEISFADWGSQGSGSGAEGSGGGL